MQICWFGYPNQTYSRNHILIDGLYKNGAKVIFCTDKSGLFLVRYWRLFNKFLLLRHHCDAIFVMFPGHLNIPIAWVLGKLFHKPIIFDAFISLYDTYVFDRQSVGPGSFKAKFYWWIDKLACMLADHVTLDTQAHIRYFVKTFKLPRKKFSRLPVGGDDTLFKPRPKTKSQQSKTIVEFHGMFTRIHGAEIFVKAAKKLEHHKNLEFWLIGSSNNYRLPIDLYHKLKPKTMKYWLSMPVDKLAAKIAQADITISHLGTIGKAKRVVGFKIMHGFSVGNTVIAPASSAMNEFFLAQTHYLAVQPGNVDDLATKINLLAHNYKFRCQLAVNGYNLYQQKFTNLQLGKKLKNIVDKQVN